VERRRRFNIGVPDGKIKHLIGAVLLFQVIPFLKHLPDHGRRTEGVFDIFRYRQKSLL
jgi:hypothetical protein